MVATRLLLEVARAEKHQQHVYGVLINVINLLAVLCITISVLNMKLLLHSNCNIQQPWTSLIRLDSATPFIDCTHQTRPDRTRLHVQRQRSDARSNARSKWTVARCLANPRLPSCSLHRFDSPTKLHARTSTFMHDNACLPNTVGKINNLKLAPHSHNYLTYYLHLQFPHGCCPY